MSDYPHEADLKRIEEWPFEEGFASLMAFVRERWQYAEHGYWDEGPSVCSACPCTSYRISTAGWSGNEDLIDSMQHNYLFWAQCWESSERGGHYEFHIPERLARPSERKP